MPVYTPSSQALAMATGSKTACFGCSLETAQLQHYLDKCHKRHQ